MHHVTGSQHAMHLAMADFLMKTTGLLIRIDQSVVDASNNDHRHLQISILSTCSKCVWYHQGRLCRARMDLRRPNRHFFRETVKFRWDRPGPNITFNRSGQTILLTSGDTV